MGEYNSLLGAFFSGKDGNSGYNAGFRQSRLAKLYQSQDPAEQEAAARQLASVDPESAGKWQQEQAKVSQQRLEQKARMLASLPSLEQKQSLYASMLPDVRKSWAEAPDQYTPDLDQALSAWAGNSQDSGFTGAPIVVQTEKGPRYARYNGQGIVPTDFVPGGSYALSEDPATGKKYKFNSKTGNYEPVDGAPSVAQAEVPDPMQPQLERINYTIAEMKKAGVPVPQINAWADNAFAEAQKQVGATGVTVQQGQSSGYVGMSAAEKASAEASAKQQAELDYAARIEEAKAKAKADVESQYGPQIAGATAQATEEGKAAGQRSAVGDKKAAEAGDALALLTEAETLLKGATGGFFGARADDFAAAFGKSTKGAEANAKLNVIAPKLIGLVPRFEGPQSDADRKLYENAAGDLGNPNKPVSIRLAAAQQMMKLYQKAQQGKQPGNGEPKRIRISL